mmetsp:Transcript_75601/g.244615  ORF Transcript_75601/g.244615 Transcript_75601/m.244615 type:complete len:119 (+) Transcript_75601:47-403(+)
MSFHRFIFLHDLYFGCKLFLKHVVRACVVAFQIALDLGNCYTNVCCFDNNPFPVMMLQKFCFMHCPSFDTFVHLPVVLTFNDHHEVTSVNCVCPIFLPVLIIMIQCVHVCAFSLQFLF